MKKPKLTKQQNEELDRDAMALAELIYDMYKEDQANGTITNGQNNAQQSTKS